MKKDITHSRASQKLMLSFQKDEATSSVIYNDFAAHVTDKKNQEVLRRIAQDEASHAAIWKNYTKQDVSVNHLAVWWYKLLAFLLGYTFIIKMLELHEYQGINALEDLIKEIPEVEHIIAQEKEHEKSLIDMLDEERLNYVGAMVLGLNDALVELTGTIAGMTFVLMNTSLIAMAGIITGIAATLSMAASNYLAERADGNPNALKASIYTGMTYLFTVVFLVLPYLLFPTAMFVPALICMILIVVFLIAVFNFYIAVVRSEAFLPKFLEMSGISLSVALISFLIGLAAKTFLGIDAG